MEKDASKNSMRVIKVEAVVLNVRVGDVVTDQFALRCYSRLGRRIQSHRKSRKAVSRGENLRTMTMSSAHCGTQSKSA